MSSLRKVSSFARPKSFGGVVLGGIAYIAYWRWPHYLAAFDKATFVFSCSCIGAAFENGIHWLLGVNTPGPPSFIAAFRKVLIARGLLAVGQMTQDEYKRVHQKAISDYFFPTEEEKPKRRTRKKELTDQP